MSFEKYINFYCDEIGTTVRKNQSASFLLDGNNLDLTKEHKLFVTGDTALFYPIKTEPDYIKKYHSIEDALDSENAYKAQYCLNLSVEKADGLTKRIYKRINFPPKLSFLPLKPISDLFDFGIYAKAENLKLEKDGYFRIALEIRYKKDGIPPLYAGDEPDERIVIDFDCGTYNWKYLGKQIKIDTSNCVMCGFWIECFNYSGNIYIEEPVFSCNGKNTLPDFSIPTTARTNYDWTSQNISKKEWPKFEVIINNKHIFCGEVFERCHIGSEWSIVIPQGILTKSENIVEIKHISDYHDVLPYTFHEISLIERSGSDFEVVAVTPVGSIGSTLPVLIKTRKDNISVKFYCPSQKLSGKDEYCFENKGLHGIQLNVNGSATDTEFFFEYDGKTIRCVCPLLCIKEQDGVVVGSGDMIYIHQDKESFEEFLCWHMSNNIGNLVTMRPTYRWSGTRVFDEALWRDFARVLNELGIKYALMVDGRELPGVDCNAPDSVIGGKGFLGRQMHERDGAVYYWGVNTYDTVEEMQEIDMGQRIFRERPQYTHTERSSACSVYEDGKIYRYRTHNVPLDYKEAHDYNIKRLSDMRFDATRHTGPTVMFKSFIEAGYKTVGAETLDSSLEPQLAFIRGISALTDNHFTVHHALQWSSTPHDRPDHTRRYRLANYISYMQGAGEVNTEEGLWRMEEMFSKFHRFTPCLKDHIKANEDFYKYTLSHSRKGRFYTPVAFISGKYDGWLNFGSTRIWGIWALTNGEPENSWDKCLKLFYPMNKLSDFLSFKYVENDDKPLGYFTGTPLGNTDVLPHDICEDVLEKYKLICFAGYNCATKEDFDKLYSICEKGCHLLISRAHFATQTDIEKVRNHDLQLLNHKLAFTKGNCVFEEKKYKGKSIYVCTNFVDGFELIEGCDDGTPLLMKYNIGKGSITILNANVYPSHDAIAELYTSYIESCTKAFNNSESTYVKCGEDVQFTVYDCENERHIYLLAVDWYNKSNEDRKAVIYDQSHEYIVSIPFGIMIKAVAKDGIIIYPTSENGEVIDICGDYAVVQGYGDVTFTVCRNGVQKEISLNFNCDAVQKIGI